MSDPTQNQNDQVLVPPASSSVQADIPPMPNFSGNNSPTNSNFFPPGVPTSPKKKFGSKQIIATFLGILLLVGGVAAGIVLILQPQLLNQQAATTNYCGSGLSCQGNPSSGGSQCLSGGVVVYCCPSGAVLSNGVCVSTSTTCKNGDTGAPACCIDPNSCTDIVCEPGLGSGRKECRLSGIWCTIQGNSPDCGNPPTPPPTPPTPPPTPPPTSASCGELCGEGISCGVGNLACIYANNGERYCSILQRASACSQNPTMQNCCGITASPSPTPTQSPSPTPTPPAPLACGDTCMANNPNVPSCPSGLVCYPYIATNPNGAGRCRNPSCLTQSSCLCPTPSPSPTPSPGPTAVCTGVKAYDSAWNLLSAAQIAGLKAGNNIDFCVAGTTNSSTFDMARFTINGVVQANTTVKRPNTNDYCQAYTIPANVYTFNVTAQIHHVILGWIGP